MRRQPIPIRLDPDLYKAFVRKVKEDGESVGSTFETYMRKSLNEHTNPRGNSDSFSLIKENIAEKKARGVLKIDRSDLKRIIYDAGLYSKYAFNQYLDVLLTTRVIEEYRTDGKLIKDVWVIA